VDAEPTKPPIIVKKLSAAERIDAIFKASASKPKVPTLTVTGPIDRLEFDNDWVDDGVFPRKEERLADRTRIFDPRLRDYHAFKLKEAPNNVLQIWHYDLPLAEPLAVYMQKLVSKVGPVPSIEWPNVPVFDRYASSAHYQIDSVDVVRSGRKNVLHMRGHHKESNQYESHIYMSRKGNWFWFSRIEFGAADKASYDRDVKKLDVLLQKVSWSS